MLSSVREFARRRVARVLTTAGCAVVLAVALSGGADAAPEPNPQVRTFAAVQQPSVPPSLASYRIVTSAGRTVGPRGYADNSAPCPAGMSVLGGGQSNSSGNAFVVLAQSYPWSNGWQVTVRNDSDYSFVFYAYAICGS